MKKSLFIFMFMVAVVALNAQPPDTSTSSARTKSSSSYPAKAQGERTPVMVSDLLKPITDDITKGYPGYTIKEATKVSKNNTVTFEVVVSKDMSNETLVYDSEGKFLKKLPTKE
jgi:hypothetical protein